MQFIYFFLISAHVVHNNFIVYKKMNAFYVIVIVFLVKIFQIIVRNVNRTKFFFKIK
jgi:hypothetical protein